MILIGLLVCFQTFAQRKPKIKGNKNVIEVREELPSFNAVKLVDDLELVLQEGPNSYTINADDNLIDVLKFKVEEDTLVISSFYKITSRKKLDIVVNYTDLEAITMIDGKVNMTDVVSSDRFTVDLDGRSRLELSATAPIMNVDMKGMSSGDFNLASDSLSISLKDRVDAHIYAVGKSNTIRMSQNASARMEGNTEVLDVQLKDSSNLKAEKMEATSVVADMKGSPDIKVKALEEFKLSSQGSSKTRLYGNPKITIESFLDTSNLLKEN